MILQNTPDSLGVIHIGSLFVVTHSVDCSVCCQLFDAVVIRLFHVHRIAVFSWRCHVARNPLKAESWIAYQTAAVVELNTEIHESVSIGRQCRNSSETEIYFCWHDTCVHCFFIISVILKCFSQSFMWWLQDLGYWQNPPWQNPSYNKTPCKKTLFLFVVVAAGFSHRRLLSWGFVRRSIFDHVCVPLTQLGTSWRMNDV